MADIAVTPDGVQTSTTAGNGVDNDQYTTICPLAYTDIEVHYKKGGGFITCWTATDDLGNSLQGGEVRLYNDDATNVKAPTIGGYEFDYWEFTDVDGKRQCVKDNPISLLTCRTA